MLVCLMLFALVYLIEVCVLDLLLRFLGLVGDFVLVCFV